MKLSIVATLYHSAPYIDEFIGRVHRVAQSIVADDYEIILVNDGSPDDSLAIAVHHAKQNSRVTVVDLSRNFGHHKAMMTGLRHSTAQHVFLIDSDLEEEPEWLYRFVDVMHTSHADVVFGVQETRRGNWIDRSIGWLFYNLFRRLTRVDLPDNVVTARLMTRRYVDALLLHREREIYIDGLWFITGFTQVHCPIQKYATSPSTYNFTRKIEHLINAVTSFSNTPLIWVFFSGMFILFVTICYIIVLCYRYLFDSAPPPDGYTSLIVSIWLLAGFIIFAIGITGIYIAKIFSEVKQRPYTIERDVYNFANTLEK